MSVQDEFFLPGDDDPSLHQGLGEDVGDPQVFDANSLAGSLNGSPVGSGRGLGGGARPPPNQGHVPSHVSVASAATSVVATSGYFVGATKRSAAEINARRVICPKSARGVIGSRDYTRHQEAATKALPHIFASAKHFHAKNAEGESSNKYANLQSEYAGNLAKIKNFKRHMDAWDMSDPFVIPKLIDPTALAVDDRWAERKMTGVHLLKNWGKLTLQQCRAWQRDSFDYASLEDLTSMEWAKTLMMNSCDALLVERIDEKFEDLSLYEQGGVTYIKLALDEMFTISNTVVATLQGFFENFAKDGIAKVPNEDVRVATEQIVAVAERLAEVSALPSECTVQLLEGLTKCSVTVFRQTFSHLLVGERLRQLRTLTTLHDSTRLGGIKKLCKEANDMFNSLNVSKEWNIPQKHRIDACFNCGDPDHGVPKCPKPIDQARIDKAKSEFSRSGGGRNGRGFGRDGRGRGRGPGRGRGDSDKFNSRGKWKSDSKSTNTLSTSTGVEKRNGKWSMMCKTCGWNTTHTTGFHSSYKDDPARFSLPTTHVYWTKSGKSPPTNGRGAPAPEVAVPPVASSASSISSRINPVIAQYQTRTDDSEFNSFLADFQRALN